jgi:hypothetical protein
VRHQGHGPCFFLQAFTIAGLFRSPACSDSSRLRHQYVMDLVARGSLLVALLGAPLSAAASPLGDPQTGTITLDLEWLEAWNRHHKFGADGQRLSSRVKGVLLPGGKARVEDRGELKRSHLSRTWGHSEELTDWSVEWIGTWRRAGARLLLELKSERRSCSEVVRRPGEKDQRRGCPSVRAVTLECERARVSVASASGAATTMQPAWRCFTRAHVIGTPTPWVFGEKRCLRATSRRPLAYEPCGARAP